MPWFLLLGIVTGMRAMTPMAVLCWFAWTQRTPLHGWAFWAGNLVSAIVFTLMALGEYFGDTRPEAPNRTAAFPAISRLLFGGLVGALACNALEEPAVGGVLFGMVGAAIGTWGGIRVRAALTRRFGRDLPAALLESALALALAIWAMHHVQFGVQQAAIWWSKRLATV